MIKGIKQSLTASVLGGLLLLGTPTAVFADSTRFSTYDAKQCDDDNKKCDDDAKKGDHDGKKGDRDGKKGDRDGDHGSRGDGDERERHRRYYDDGYYGPGYYDECGYYGPDGSYRYDRRHRYYDGHSGYYGDRRYRYYGDDDRRYYGDDDRRRHDYGRDDYYCYGYSDDHGQFGSSYVAEMSADQEVPNRGPSGAEGTANIGVDSAKGRVCYRLAYRGIGHPTAAHIHEGVPGRAGPVVIDLGRADNGDRACIPADPSLIAEIQRHPEDFYVNVHTADFPDGAIRGQLIPGDKYRSP